MNNSLEKEASILSPIFQEWFSLVTEKKMPEYDFGGLYILAYLATRRPHKWSCGKFSTPLASPDDYFSMKLMDIPHILPILTERYFIKLFGLNCAEITVVSIFASLRFTGIKKNSDNFVNQCIVSWALKKRPFVLLTEIPTPLQVLRMQAKGQRVVTAFLSHEELSSHHIAKLHYMEGHQNHSKDAFEFFVHDLKHMEHFVDPNTYQEQTGFFHSILTMSSDPSISPKKFLRMILNCHTLRMISNSHLMETIPVEEVFKNHFQQLWNELEYLVSDMNCYLPHLMKYLVAKLTINCHQLYHEILNQVLLYAQSHPDLSASVIPTFSCYLRNIWIELIRAFQISFVCRTMDPDSGDDPFTACMSMMNHSLEHSPLYPTQRTTEDLEAILTQCVCGECDRYSTSSLSIRDEGETLRTFFRDIAISRGIIVE